MSKGKPPVLARAIDRGLSRFAGERAQALIPQARLAGPMPWVIAIMVALTVVAAAGGLALSNLANSARADVSGGLTVQVLEADPEERDRQAEMVVAILANSDGVEDARRVPDEELNRLLEPWLGDLGAAAADVPIPALVDAQLSGPVTPQRLERIREALAGRAPSAQVDAQSSWLAPVFSAIASLQYLAIGLVLLLAFATGAAVWLAARSALGGNRETIEIVHLLGGTDRQIARIFQRSIAFDAFLGGVAGLALGLIAIFLLADQFASLGSGMVAGAGLGILDWVALAAVPLAAIALAGMTARLTVLSALRKML